MNRDRAGVTGTLGRRIGYARVSTEDQRLALQIDALVAAGCDLVFQDNGFSGGLQSRPGLEKALAALQPGDVLLVWKLDRLGRSLAHLISIITALGARDVGFRSLSESIDTTTAGGRLIFHVMGALAEFERALISERTKAGMAAAKARGVRVGRPRKLSESAVRTAISEAESGCSSGALASRLGVSQVTLARALRRLGPAA